MRIDNNVFMSYLRCQYKACLLLEGRSSQPTNHQVLIDELDSAYNAVARTALSRKYASINTGGDCAYNQPLITFEPRIVLDSCEFVLDALIQDADAPGSQARDLPVIFCRSDRISPSEKLRLALGGHLLRFTEGSSPASGIVVYGPNCSIKTVPLMPKYATAERILTELVSFATGQCRPPLILNNQCRACEFQQSCREEAKKQDNLTLLHRMTEKTIRQYNRKGIFTVNRLSYTGLMRRLPKLSVLLRTGNAHMIPFHTAADFT